MPRSLHSRNTAAPQGLNRGTAPAPSPASENGARRRGERAVPGMRIALLRADVERHAVGLEAALHGMLEHVDRHGGLAAEFARQRPLGADAVRQDAAENAR